MKTTDEKVYRCDYCNRAIVSAGSMKLHERMCKKNPNNRHECFKYCKFLKKENGYLEDEEYENEVMFTCEKQPELSLYSYKLERFKKNAGRIRDLTRMPLNCDLYEVAEGHNYNEPDYLYD
jgi:hypothetical protein